jgi:hypothetical protein
MAVSSDIQILYDMLKIKENFNYPTFVETGTSNGQSTRIFSEHFEKTYTCDNSEYQNEQRQLTLNSGKNITFMLGDSRDCLPLFFREIKSSEFFLFLDAHGTSWPILDELQIVADFNYKPVIFIHDFDCGHEGWKFDCWGPNDIIHLDYEYVKPKMDLIYGENGYDYYLSETSLAPPDGEGKPNLRGCGYFYPKQ